MPRVIRPLLPAAIALVLLVQPVAGARPGHDTFTVDETFQEELCGIAVTGHVVVKGNVLIFEDQVLDLSLVTLTWTNADGDWLQNFVAGPLEIQEELNGDILTVVARHVGIHERLRSSDGLTVAFDRGQVIFRDVIDLNDPENPDDDELISTEVLFQAGPHPESDSDFELFCEIVVDVLG